jgi:hypothetical protein
MISAELPSLLQSFFTDRLLRQRRASSHTIAGYRDCFRLLLHFAKERLGKVPSKYRGSSDILAGVDMAYTLEADQGQLKLNRFKNRFGSERLFTIAADFAAGKFTLTDSGAAVERREDLAVLRDIIERNPGLSQNKILQLAGLQRTRGHELLTKHTGVLWEMRDGPHSSRLYFLKTAFQPVPAPVPDITSGTTPGTTQ